MATRKARDRERRQRKSSWAGYAYRFPDVSNPYTYLQLLGHNAGNAQSLETAIRNQAAGILNKAATELTPKKAGEKPTLFTQALILLQNAAAQERQAEVAYLQSLKKKLKELDAPILNEINAAIEQLTKWNGDRMAGYQQMIAAISSAKMSIAETKGIINRLTANNINIDPKAGRVRQNLMESIDTTFQSLEGTRQSLYFGPEEAIRQATLKFFEIYGQQFIADNANIGSDGRIQVAAAISLIQNRLATYTTNVIDSQYKSASQKVEDQENQEKARMTDLFSRIMLALESNENNIQNELTNLLRNVPMLESAAKQFGIQESDGPTKKGKRPAAHVKKRMEYINELVLQDQNERQKQTREAMKTMLKDVKVTWNDKHKVSIADEFTSSSASGIFASSHMGRLGGATDAILIELGEIMVNIPADRDLLAKIMRSRTTKTKIQSELQALKGDLATSNTIHDAHAIKSIFLKRMEKIEQLLSDINGGFIIHETTKFYQTLETGQRQQQALSGREMVWHNYISNMSALASEAWDEAGQINTTLLNFIFYNLASDALGSNLENPLKQYLSMFAGMIMFDGFVINTPSALKEIAESNTRQIHMYRIEDLYVPCSLFLTQVITQMQQLIDNVEKMDNPTSMGITVNITGIPTINYSENKKAYGDTLNDRWDPVKHKSDQINVKILFAAGFLDFISKIPI